MIDQMIILFAQSRVGWAIFGALGLLSLVVLAYYLSLAVYFLIVCILRHVSFFSPLAKLMPENCRFWRRDKLSTHDTTLEATPLGYTMPDGGEPINEVKRKNTREA